MTRWTSDYTVRRGPTTALLFRRHGLWYGGFLSSLGTQAGFVAIEPWKRGGCFGSGMVLCKVLCGEPWESFGLFWSFWSFVYI
jgi:hypothetical protein